MLNPPGLLSYYSNLRETPESETKQRTEWNVRDSDKLLILKDSKSENPSCGTDLAIEFAKKYNKPTFIVDLNMYSYTDGIISWLCDNKIPHALNIAGPRESECPGIYKKSVIFLEMIYRQICKNN